MKHIILCADDYGQNTVISQAIIELLQKKSLSATSCMANSYDWMTHAKWLEPFKDEADIGLHFNLTEGRPLSKKFTFLPLNELMLNAFLGRIDQSAVEIELHSQLDQFTAGLGKAPDFIDGHQHIHQLPVIRQAVLKVYKERFPQRYVYLRSVYAPLITLRQPAYLKKLIIQFSGARALRNELIKQNIPHNRSFSGIYHFSEDVNEYSTRFPQFLKEVADQGIIMCHPSLAGSDNKDPIAAARKIEYHYFSNEKFRQDCEEQGIQLGRFKT